MTFSGLVSTIKAPFGASVMWKSCRGFGAGLFTTYLLPFEITSILLLMAIVGAITLARRGGLLPKDVVVVPGYQVLARDVLDPFAPPEAPPIVAHSTREVEEELGLAGVPHLHDDE